MNGYPKNSVSNVLGRAQKTYIIYRARVRVLIYLFIINRHVENFMFFGATRVLTSGVYARSKITLTEGHENRVKSLIIIVGRVHFVDIAPQSAANYNRLLKLFQF